MIAKGQPLAQFGAFLSGQHGISPVIVMAVESTVMARAGVGVGMALVSVAIVAQSSTVADCPAPARADAVSRVEGIA